MKPFLTLILGLFFYSTWLVAHVAISYPAGNEEFNAVSKVNISWYIDIDHGDCNWDIYLSSNNGYSWNLLAENLLKSQLEMEWVIPGISTDYAKIRIVQDNYEGPDYQAETGAFSIIPGTTGNTEEEISVDDFLLFPAYPNPFNSTAVISFQLPQKEFVRVSIFNIAGEIAETLLAEELPAGLHRIAWNARNTPTGVYFYSVEAGNFTRTRKLILIK